jgi:hypothetical protein
MVIYANVIEIGADVEPLPPNESISVLDEDNNPMSVFVPTADGKAGLPFPLNFKTSADFLDWYNKNKGKLRSSWTR